MDDARKLLRECREYMVANDHAPDFYVFNPHCIGCQLRDRIDSFLAQPAASAERETTLKEILSTIRRECSVDDNGDPPLDGKPEPGWEDGCAAGTRMCYRTIKAMLAAAGEGK